MLSRLAVNIFGHDYVVQCSRARDDLGWRGTRDYGEAIRESVASLAMA
jgi:hypothetical protein